MNKSRNLLAVLFTAFVFISAAQETDRQFPPAFVITSSELNSMLAQAEGSTIDIPANPFIHHSKVEMNTLNGDMRFLRLRSAYFPGSLLTIQVNGAYSTQVFVISDPGGIYYRGTANPDGVKMEKCEKDDIVVE